jgi:2'-5' RNA ligase
MKRTFIAIKLSINGVTQDFLDEVKNELKNEKVRWVDVINFHLTLFFIGDTQQEMISKISNCLRSRLKLINGFDIFCKGLGVFRNVKKY